MSASNASPSGKTPRVSWKALARSFQHRDYRLFFTGQFISLVGTWMQQVAQSWLVYRLTGSSLSLGLVGFAGQFPVFLLSVFGGVMADRLNRRFVLVGTQVAAMLQAAVLAGLTLAGSVQVWEVVVLAAFLGAVNAVDIPTRQSFVVELVGKKDLHNAIALNSSMFNLARILGPSLAGMLLAAVGEGWCFALNAVSFLAVIACLLRMNAPRRPAPERTGSMREHLGEGFAYAWRTAAVRSVLFLLGVMSVISMSYVVLMPVFASDILSGGPRALGLLMAASGVGSLAGALMLAMRSESRGLGRFAYFGMLGFGACLVLFSQSTLLPLSAALMLPAGFCMIVSMAAANTILQTLCPDHLRGRVMALFTMMFMGMAPFGALLSGSLAHVIGAPATVAAGGAACVLMMGLGGRRLLLL
ncbi:MAG: MFS transporter [Desulfovibrionaceae bacterium]|nr:MFS transporter [Desulfovibrionaceae bacterium]MBF0480343.1 MFS transporter [Desulfovibrionaceae bacterium]MBF0512965.1 MFS transporter [Desulfovibrionaceae bacterium]